MRNGEMGMNLKMKRKERNESNVIIHTYQVQKSKIGREEIQNMKRVKRR